MIWAHATLCQSVSVAVCGAAAHACAHAYAVRTTDWPTETAGALGACALKALRWAETMCAIPEQAAACPLTRDDPFNVGSPPWQGGECKCM